MYNVDFVIRNNIIFYNFFFFFNKPYAEIEMINRSYNYVKIFLNKYLTFSIVVITNVKLRVNSPIISHN